MRDVRPPSPWVWVIAALAAPAAPACSFPEIGFASTGGTGGTSSSGGVGGTSSSGGAGGTGGVGGTSSSSGGTGGMAGGGGVGGMAGSGGAGDVCDGDGDGHLAMGGRCNGTDCDDTNGLIYPDQPIYYTTPNDKGYDWDCDGETERDPLSDKSISCSLGSCDTVKQGYIGTVPTCGNTGQWGRCKKGFLTCGPEILEDARKMACK